MKGNKSCKVRKSSFSTFSVRKKGIYAKKIGSGHFLLFYLFIESEKIYLIIINTFLFEISRRVFRDPLFFLIKFIEIYWVLPDYKSWKKGWVTKNIAPLKPGMVPVRRRYFHHMESSTGKTSRNSCTHQ